MRRHLSAVFAIVAMLCVAWAALGCGQPLPAVGWIDGEVYIGPISPVEQPGVSNERGYGAALLIERASDEKLIATVRSDAKGSFILALPPGMYLLEPVNGDPLPRAPSQRFTIWSGLHTRVRVDYDSGIR